MRLEDGILEVLLFTVTRAGDKHQPMIEEGGQALKEQHQYPLGAYWRRRATDTLPTCRTRNSGGAQQSVLGSALKSDDSKVFESLRGTVKLEDYRGTIIRH